MAKNTHAQEVSTGTSASYTEEELLDPQPVVITRPILGEVDRKRITKEEEEVPSPVKEDGGDFTPSSQSGSPESSKPNQSLPLPVPMTENPSSPTQEDNSGVDSTDGDGHKTEPQPSGNRGRQTPPTVARKAAPAKKATPAKQTGARATMMGAEDGFDDF